MHKNIFKRSALVSALILGGLTLEASSLVTYHSDSDTDLDDLSAATRSASVSSSARKTKSKSRLKRTELIDLASAFQDAAKTSYVRTRVQPESPLYRAAHLRLAAFTGEVTKVSELLALSEVNLLDTDSTGHTALHYAAVGGHVEVLRLLLEYAKTHAVSSPVVPAGQSSSEKAWEYTLKAKNSASKLIKSTDQSTQEAITALARKIEPNDEKRSKAFTTLAEGLWAIFLEPDEQKKQRDEASSLVSIPFVDIRNQHQATALHLAVFQGHELCVKILLDYDANREYCAQEKKEIYAFPAGRPLHIACLTGNVSLVQLLIARKANIKARDTSKKSMLHAAAIGGNQKLVKQFLDLGLQEALTDSSGKTAAQYAHDVGNYQVAAFFLINSGGVNYSTDTGLRPLHFAAMANDCTLASYLEKEGALLNPVDAQGFTPTHYAAQKGALQMLSWCLDRVPYLSGSADTILSVAARAGQKEALEKIVQRADEIQPNPIVIEAENSLVLDGREVSYMVWALEEKLPDFVDILHDTGNVPKTAEAKLIRDLWRALRKTSSEFDDYPQCLTAEGATPLHLAAEQEHKVLCSKLIESRAAHELLKLGKECYKDMYQDWMTLQAEELRKAQLEIDERNAQARERGYEELPAPAAEKFSMPILHDEEKLKNLGDDTICKIIATYCWHRFKENESTLLDSSSSIGTSLRETILLSIPAERVKKVLLEYLQPYIQRALATRGHRGVYQVTPPQAALINSEKLESEKKEAEARADSAQKRANRESINESNAWHEYYNERSYGHYAQATRLYEKILSCQEQQVKDRQEVEDENRKVAQLQEKINFSKLFKEQLESPVMLEDIVKQWCNLQ